MDIGYCEHCGYFAGSCGCKSGRECGKLIFSAKQRTRTSKFLSGLLRHFASDFDLDVDPRGWADVDEVAQITEEKYNIGVQEIQLIVDFDPKERFEIKGREIRARYGHSIEVRTDWTESEEIPSKLYHATDPKKISSVLHQGLLPMKRREVHMCNEISQAIEVGKRHCPEPVLLEIDAHNMVNKGYKVKKKGKIYTADFVPSQFIEHLG